MSFDEIVNVTADVFFFSRLHTPARRTKRVHVFGVGLVRLTPI